MLQTLLITKKLSKKLAKILTTIKNFLNLSTY